MSREKKLADDSVLVDNTDEVLRAMDSAISRALNAVGIKAEVYAKAKCPVRTGRLRNSITHTISGAGPMTHVYSDNKGNKFGGNIGSPEGTANAVYIGTNVEYAPYVEFGVKGKKRKAKPFLRPAARDHVNEYREIIKTYLQKG